MSDYPIWPRGLYAIPTGRSHDTPVYNSSDQDHRRSARRGSTADLNTFAYPGQDASSCTDRSSFSFANEATSDSLQEHA